MATRTRNRGLVVAALTLAASAARSQPADDGERVAPSTPPAGIDLQATCVALLNGDVPPDVAPSEIRPRCISMLRRGAIATPEAGVGRQEPDAGAQVLAAFEQAGRELVGRGESQAALGTPSRGPSRTLVTTNPIGWFSGMGVNATLSRALHSFSKMSWIASARYARANASNGNVTTVGLGTGADLFIFGRNNEGLRLGPRLELAFGDESFGGNTTYARLGLSGELGYNFVASNGISVLGAVGLGGRVVGDAQNENFTSFTGGEFGPYLKLGLGYAF